MLLAGGRNSQRDSRRAPWSRWAGPARSRKRPGANLNIVACIRISNSCPNIPIQTVF